MLASYHVDAAVQECHRASDMLLGVRSEVERFRVACLEASERLAEIERGQVLLLPEPGIPMHLQKLISPGPVAAGV